MATASGARRISGLPGSGAPGARTFGVCPHSLGKKGDTRGWQTPGASEAGLEPDLGGGPHSCRLRLGSEGRLFCSPGSVSSPVKRLPPAPDLPVLGRLASEVHPRLRAGGEVGAQPLSADR